ERVRLGERGAVAEEEHRSRRGPIREEEVGSELVRRGAARGPEPRGGGRVEHEREAGAWVLEGFALLGEVLPYVTEENVAGQLVLELEPRNVGDREAASVARSGDALVGPQSLDPHRLCGPPCERHPRGDLAARPGLRKDRHGAV